MTPSELTRLKFHACTGNIRELLGMLELPMELDDLMDPCTRDLCIEFSQLNDSDQEAFNKFLIKNDMEEYSSLLIPYLNWTFNRSKFNWDIDDETFEDMVRQNDERKRKLAQYLNYFLSKKEGKYYPISFPRQRGNLKITEMDIISLIVDSTIKTLTEEFEIYQGSDLLSKYDEFRSKDGGINLDFLTKVMSDNSNGKRKAGARQKNQIIYSVATKLSYIKRIDAFLKGDDNTTDIQEIPLKDEDCRFIHGCLATFGFIEDRSKHPVNGTTPAKYIRSILNQGKKRIYSPEHWKKLKEMILVS